MSFDRACAFLCRHGRDVNGCEQCKWEMQEQAKRFHDHVARNLREERKVIENRQEWLKRQDVFYVDPEGYRARGRLRSDPTEAQ